MPTEPPIIQVEFTSRFQRDVRTLAKRDRSIRDDIQRLIEQLKAVFAPLAPQNWGNKSQSPPELGDLGGLHNL